MQGKFEGMTIFKQTVQIIPRQGECLQCHGHWLNWLQIHMPRSDYSWGFRIYEKLDRGLRNDIWIIQFPNAHVWVLTRLDYSCHHPILVSLTDNDHRRLPRALKFECAWVLEDTYDKIIKKAWKEGNSLGANLQEIRSQAIKWKLYTIRSIQKGNNHIMVKIRRNAKKCKDTRGSLFGAIGRKTIICIL